MKPPAFYLSDIMDDALAPNFVNYVGFVFREQNKLPMFERIYYEVYDLILCPKFKREKCLTSQ